MILMKKPLLSLLISLLFVPATPVLAENIHYDGTDSGMLGTDPFFNTPDSLLPHGFSGNTVIVDAPGYTIGGHVIGGVSEVHDNVTGNTVILKKGTINQNVFGGVSTYALVMYNAVTIAGGKVNGSVIGGASTYSTANLNTVTMTGGEVTGNLQGGEGFLASIANGNTVSITGGSVGGSISGGKASFGMTNNNTVTMSGGNVAFDVYGGYTPNGDEASYNTVSITGGQARNIYGGYGNDAIMENNRITVAGGQTHGSVSGAYSANGSVTDNSVSVSGGHISGNVFGGDTLNAIAMNNTVTVSGGQIDGNVAGGRSQNGSAVGNTVNLSGGTINGSVTGGYERQIGGDSLPIGNAPGISLFAGNDFFTGNTLNVSNRFSLSTLSNFQYFNFTLPAGFQAGSGDALISASNVEFGGTSTVSSINSAPGGRSFSVGDTVTLISSVSPFTNSSLATNTAQGTKGFALLYNWDLNLEPTALTATLSGATVNPQSHALLAGRASELALLKQGGDLLASQALENMVTSAKAGNKGFFAMQGGHSRYESGSSFGLDSFTLMAGASWGTKVNSGNDLSGGVFVEAGTGSYDSNNSFTSLAAVKSDGNAHYFGAGAMGNLDFNNGFSIDGAVRAGRIKSDLNTDLYAAGQRGSYDDTSSTYLGAHFGGAYRLAISQQDQLNTYARYSWTHVNSDNVTVLDDPYHFDSANSHRVRVGTKYARTSGLFQPYAGIAYEYEFDGKSRGNIYGYDIKAMNLGGSTFIGELGVSWFPTNNDNLRLNVTLEGFAGKREGAMGSFRLNYRF